ncbi:rta1 domain protein [Fusarium oxysporum f. sp. phaseoli]
MATAATATSTSLICISVPPNEHGHVFVGACGAIWPYHPSFDSNLAIIIIFAISTLAHAVQSLFFRQVRTYSQASRTLRLAWLGKLPTLTWTDGAPGPRRARNGIVPSYDRLHTGSLGI